MNSKLRARLWMFSVSTALLSMAPLSGCKTESVPPSSEGAPASEGAPTSDGAPVQPAVGDAAAPLAPAGDGPTAQDIEAAKGIFASRCTPCHGSGGAGDGAASAGLTPKPANFTDPAWQAMVTDEHIEKIIAYGGSAVGKSPAMPPNPDLASKKGVIQGLRMHIRTLKK